MPAVRRAAVALPHSRPARHRWRALGVVDFAIEIGVNQFFVRFLIMVSGRPPGRAVPLVQSIQSSFRAIVRVSLKIFLEDVVELLGRSMCA